MSAAGGAAGAAAEQPAYTDAATSKTPATAK
jgi:hypothetical protein